MARTKRTPHTTPSAQVSFSAPGASKIAAPSKGKTVDNRTSLDNPDITPEPASSSIFAALSALDDDDNNSVLSEVSNVSALAFSPNMTLPNVRELDLTESEPARKKRLLTHALNTLQFTPHHPSTPLWLTGLPKPLPHPSLTALKDFEIETRLWFDEIARLQHLRSKLPPSGEGEWRYEHFGSTIEVKEKKDGVARNVFARGVWTLVVGGEEEVRVVLDKWPVTVEGELLGWGVRGEVGDFLVGEEVEEEEVDEEAEDELGTEDEADKEEIEDAA